MGEGVAVILLAAPAEPPVYSKPARLTESRRSSDTQAQGTVYLDPGIQVEGEDGCMEMVLMSGGELWSTLIQRSREAYTASCPVKKTIFSCIILLKAYYTSVLYFTWTS